MILVDKHKLGDMRYLTGGFQQTLEQHRLSALRAKITFPPAMTKVFIESYIEVSDKEAMILLLKESQRYARLEDNAGFTFRPDMSWGDLYAMVVYGEQ